MKLKNYIPLLIIFAALNLNAREPSIIVHDYNPDVLFWNKDSKDLEIDLDADSVNDVIFHLEMSSSDWHLYLKTLIPDCYTSKIIYSNTDSLSSNLIYWVSNENEIRGEFNKSEKVGVKKIVNGHIYYGWIYIYFKVQDFNTLWYIDKFAFCTIPDYPLLWGQTELTGANNKLSARPEISFSFDSKSKVLTIENNIKVKNFNIEIIDLSGKTIIRRKVSTGYSEYSSVLLNDLNQGVYLIKLTSDENNSISQVEKIRII